MPLTKNHNHLPYKHRTKCSGFTLLEVMVAMLIFSIGLLGIAGLQAQSVQYNHSAYLKSQASFFAYDILEKMRANRAIALSGTYMASYTTTGFDNGCYDVTGNCSESNMALHDVFDWKQILAQLPEGNGSITSTTVSGVTTFIIKVIWKDRSAADGSGIESITIRSEV